MRMVIFSPVGVPKAEASPRDDQTESAITFPEHVGKIKVVFERTMRLPLTFHCILLLHALQ